MRKADSTTKQLQRAGAVVLGMILPGLGHISIGQKRRGYLIMGGIMFLLFWGVLVGGIDAIDHENDGLWFIAQAWCGLVVVLIDILNQIYIVPLPVAERATLVGLSHVNEIGTLFVAMAGLMNFVVLLDLFQARMQDDLERRVSSQSAGDET